METKLFPAEFLWGASTSAYQVEGSPLADGAGASDWHVFVHEAGHILDGSTGDVACDHYRQFESDIQLMAKLGLRAYRFSVSWSRIFPEGIGRKNPRGIEFYSRLIDTLLSHNIEPFLTLYHWDLPAAIADRGGWTNPDSADWFSEYAQTLFRAFRGRVRYWSTLNEPGVVVHNGYVTGEFPPGRTNLAEAAKCSHNLLRAHALAVRAFRADPTGQVGVVLNLEPKEPASNAPQDVTAAVRADAYTNRQFLDPLFLGFYPAEMRDIYCGSWSTHSESDMVLIREPFDFLGVNYYTRYVVRAEPQVGPVGASSVRQEGAEYTEMGWEVFPTGLRRTLLWIKQRYGDIPLYITENGAAFADPTEYDHLIKDVARVNFFRNHLLAAHQALEEGVNLRGFFAWSIFDNFEWTFGYTKRFGVFGVDFTTQRRIPKLSAKFYQEVIQSRGSNIL
jgi:beta-glucosidase